MFEIINPKTNEKGRQHDGDYTDHLPALRKIAPVTIIQYTPHPNEDGTTSYPVHITPPAQKAVWRGKIARYCVIALLAALLATSCTESPANGNLPIADLETGQYCEPSHTPDYRAIVFAQNELIIAYEEKTEELASVIMTAFPAYRSDYHDIDSLSNILDSLYIN